MVPHSFATDIDSSRRMAQGSSRREPAYQPPVAEQIQVLALGDLVPDSRPIVLNQQARLGFEAEGLGLRIWCVGDVSLARKPAIAIVGTRNVSANGAARARRLSKELAKEGVVIFSGLAKGVDTEALQSAIGAKGRVVAVIGTPIDRAYPAENKRLQEEIYREHLLISQFQPNRPVFPGNFPERNKLMAAMSDGTAIIEAGETSGTLHQAAECVRLGRWLFVASSLLEDRALEWPRSFQNYPRFRPLTRTEDVLSALAE
jgi:DNA processing protein